MLANNIHPDFAAIIEKYTNPLGSTHSNDDVDVEDSTNVDRFGFYRPDGVRERELTKEEYQKLSRRLEKWRLMTAGANEENSNWRRLFRNGYVSEKLKRRVFKGIPQQYRLVVWPLLLGVAEAKKEHQNLYTDMLTRALATSVHLDQIDKDINRTFRNTTYFRARYGPRQQSLFRILAAYSVYNNEVGYCQGMSELVGLFLTYMIEEEDVFWAFSQLMTSPKHRMHGLFVRDFPGLYRLFDSHERVTKKLLPHVYKHFTEQDLPTSTYALKWFMQCFLDRLPFSLVLRLWDIYLLEGERILIAMAYNILKLHKKRLLRMDQTQLTCFFQDELVRDFYYDDDSAIESLKDCLEQLHRTKLDQLPPPTPNMLPTRPLGTFAPEMIWQSQPLPSPKSALGKEQQASPSKPFPDIVDTLNGPRPPVHRRTIGPSATASRSRTPSGLDTSASILTAAAMANRSRAASTRHGLGSPNSTNTSSNHPAPSLSDVRLSADSNKGTNTINKPLNTKPPRLPSPILSPSQRASSSCYLHDHVTRSQAQSPSNAVYYGYATTDSRRRIARNSARRSQNKSDVVLLSIGPRKSNELAHSPITGAVSDRAHLKSTVSRKQDVSGGQLNDNGKSRVVYTASQSSTDSSGFGDKFPRCISSTSSSTGPDDPSQLWRRRVDHGGANQHSDVPYSRTLVSPTESESSWVTHSRQLSQLSESPCMAGLPRSPVPSVVPKDGTLVPQIPQSPLYVSVHSSVRADDVKSFHTYRGLK